MGFSIASPDCRTSTNTRQTGELTVEEVQDAKRRTIVLMQKEFFPEEYKILRKGVRNTKLALVHQLNLYLDNEIRCKGRLEHAQLPKATKFPILLPKSCYVTQVVVKEHHDAVAHMGVNVTVASVRWEFWIPQIRQLTKSVLHHCVICRRTQGRPLREFRVQCKQPYNITGVDYAGTLCMKGNKQSPEKAYIIMFTCPKTMWS